MSNQHRNSKLRALVALSLLPVSTLAAVVDPSILQACPGYTATNVRTKRDGLTADLTLRGSGCNVFGPDINKLSLNVVYETSDRIHVKIVDASAARYEVPASVFPRPDARRSVPPQAANIRFNYTTSPFSFSVYRANTREVLFSTAGNPLIFEPQYLRVKTNLPQNPNIYGLGEHTNPFHLPTDNLTLTLWSRDAYGISPRSNLYGNHPVYFEHRTTGTHGVFLLNSNGMDVKLNSNSLEYNIIGGVLDFYFLAGSERDPTELARQYSEVVGLPAEVPYWSFGFHQCRFGYRDFVDVANVIVRYAASKIPLETMWTDIDYMDRRRTFTLDPDYFPLKKVREIVDYLHGKGQKYIMMTDPAIGYFPGEGYAAYEEGKELDIYLKNSTGDPYIGLVWAGVSVFPDWFHKNIRKYWTNQFKRFYNPQTGVDIDGVWIDMNEPASFCIAPCADPYAQSIEQKLPPPRPRLPPNADTPLFTNTSAEVAQLSKRDDIVNPPYAIDNAIGSLSNKTADTSIKQYNGLTQYDTHNLYGSMMSTETRHAMLARRPSKKPLIITRSTFAGAGAHVGKWLGDNLSLWDHYRFSIAGMLGFASIYQVPMVGSDICGFGGNTTETLCARWASLGAFQPFMRNHNGEDSISQEFYIWPTVAEAARSAIDVRYRLMDYLYTAFHQAHLDGTPVLHPLWFKYPKDSNTFPIDLQFFYGDSILVSPVTEDDATAVSIYLPKDTFYDFNTLAPVQGTGSFVKFENVSFTEIPLHIKSGVVLPLRSKSAMTTIELRKTDFELVVAPNARGEASGSLYIDDGESLVVTSSTNVKFAFTNGKLDVSGRFGYRTGVNVARVRFLGVNANPSRVTVDGRSVKRSDVSYDAANKVLDVTVGVALNKGFSVQYSR